MFKNKTILTGILILSLFLPLCFLASEDFVPAGGFAIVHAQASGNFYGDNNTDETSPAETSIKELMSQGQGITNGLVGVGMLSSLAAFTFTAFNLGKSGDAKARSEAIRHLIAISITTACLGGFPLLYHLFLTMIL